MKEYIRYSRQNQKLIYWMIQDYANYISGNNPGAKASTFSKYKAKKELKKAFLKHSEYKATYKPIEGIRASVLELFIECMDQEPNKEEIPYLFTDIVMQVISEWVQELLMTLEGTFSLALSLMSQKMATEFTNWLFEYCFSNDIPFRKEIMELYSESEDEKRIYLCLKYQRCCISGEYVKFPHHVEHATKHGGYKHDKGDLCISPLSSLLHQLVHSIGEESMKKKYPMYSKIRLNNEQIETMQTIYKGYAEGYKKDLELIKGE